MLLLSDPAERLVVDLRPTPCDLLVYRGDTVAFDVTFTDDLGTVVDLTGATVAADVRSGATNIPFTITIDDPTSGVALVTLPPVLSAALSSWGSWDLQLTADGVVQTVLAGTVRAGGDVTL